MRFRPAGRTKKKLKPLLAWSGVGLLVLLGLLALASRLIDGPLRRYLEKQMNQPLQGYQVTLKNADLHLLGFSLTLEGLTVVQEAHPEPPVAFFPRLTASVHWYEILFGRLVAEFELESPRFHLNLLQLEEEAGDEVPVEERGWQEAVQSIYPLKINRLEVTGASLTYIDQDPESPLTMGGLHLVATNIRNIHSPEDVYPSPFFLEGKLLDEGRVRVDGRADFLAEPYPATRASIELRTVPLVRLQPLGDRASLEIKNGVLSARGEYEYSQHAKTARLQQMRIDQLALDYIHSERTARLAEKRLKQAEEAAEYVEQHEELTVSVERVEFHDSILGYENRTIEPPYRVFVSKTQATLTNFSDGFRQGAARAELRGSFMGSGSGTAAAVFRPAKTGSDFDLQVKIQQTPIRTLNDLLRAYAGFDAAAGTFELFAELSVRGEQITGYVKPLFGDLEVYTGEEGEGILQKIYEGVVGGLIELLENPREEVATKADIYGRVKDPEASTLQIVLQLLKNAFFKSILPGFEKAVGKAGKEE